MSNKHYNIETNKNYTLIKNNSSHLEILSFSKKFLTLKIDFVDFKYTKKINCSFNGIVVIGVLPDSLVELNCSNNLIENLNDLPETLIKLYCYNNKLTNLDNLPKNLKYLGCSNNNIERFDNLPLSLEELNCSRNPIKNLNFLPCLEILYCDILNNINDLNLSDLPPTIKILRCNDISDNKKIFLSQKVKPIFYNLK